VRVGARLRVGRRRWVRVGRRRWVRVGRGGSPPAAAAVARDGGRAEADREECVLGRHEHVLALRCVLDEAVHSLVLPRPVILVERLPINPQAHVLSLSCSCSISRDTPAQMTRHLRSFFSPV
jgi:hypothetical protein